MIPHSRHAAAAAILAAVALGCSGQDSGRPEPAPGEVVARVNGEPITMGDLDEFIKEDLFEQETRGRNEAILFRLREQSLETMIAERLLDDAAREEGTDRAQLLEKVRGDVEVSDAEILEFYEQVREHTGNASLDELAPRIREHLADRKGREAEDAYVDELRRKRVEIFFEPLRVEVAADGPTLGMESAPITIVEFSDFQCPYCARALPTVKDLHARYPDTVRIVYRHYPLDSIHPQARPAAEASVCADAQGKFWPYHDLLFANAKALTAADLERYAQEVGLDMEAWRSCLTLTATRDKVEEDLQAGVAAGVSGTPAFFVNGVMLSGAQPPEAFDERIDAELARLAEAEPEDPA